MVADSFSLPVVLVVNQKMVPAPLLHSTETIEPVVIPEPARWLEDANERIAPRAIWAVQHGCQRLAFVPNDTDTVTRLPRFIHMLVNGGRRNLWVEFGTAENRRLLPMHDMAERMGGPLCRALVKGSRTHWKRRH